MCGRYTFFPQENEEAARLYQFAKDKFGEEAVRTGEIYPSYAMPVYREGGGAMGLSLFSWGYPKEKGSIINARRETAAQKPFFRRDLELHRCVVPSTGFYEWKKTGEGKEKYRFTLPGAQMLYMAGIYKVKEGAPYFMILTAQANASMAEVHERMPLVLTGENIRLWLTDYGAARELLCAEVPMLQKIRA